MVFLCGKRGEVVVICMATNARFSGLKKVTGFKALFFAVFRWGQGTRYAGLCLSLRGWAGRGSEAKVRPCLPKRAKETGQVRLLSQTRDTG